MYPVVVRLSAVFEASVQLHKSTKLRRVLEIVLAFGNYMNRGQRGNASGFKVVSLNKIGDTKSSIDRKVTLLHYLVAVLERQVRPGSVCPFHVSIPKCKMKFVNSSV